MTDRALRAAAAALVAIVGIWAGVRVYSTWTTPGARHRGIATPVGEASPPLSSDLVDQPHAGLAGSNINIPDRLPAFTLANLGGVPTPIAHWQGKSLVINFWATWCAPCRREIPMLRSLAAQWADRGVVVVGVAVDHAQAVARYAEELKIPYPLLVGEQDALDAALALGVASPVFPFTVFTDDAGEIVALYIGELHSAQADLILSRVHSVDRHELSLVEARRSIAAGLGRLAENTEG
jgi:thiol-disulfide isomerase/thioredoxin